MKAGTTGFDYDALDDEYPSHRRTDPQIASTINRALGQARTVLNVGAGTGSYEPHDRYVVALEPSQVMRAERAPHLVPALAGTVERIDFDDGAFDASMAVLTVHHWPELEQGLAELRRVTAGPVVVLTFDAEAKTDFWLADYVPEMADVEMRRYGPVRRIVDALGGSVEVTPVPVPRDCLDRFQVALYARPEWFLKKSVRAAQSAWSHLPPGVEERFAEELGKDLKSGEWDRRYGALRTLPEISCQLRLVVAHP